ncbi:MAG: cation:proton antiporter [Mycobacteriaceae bacterium]
MLATVLPAASARYERLGELLSELGKDVALLIFATLLTRPLIELIGVGGWVLAVFTVFVARPLPVLVSLIRSNLDRRERLTAAWFGPKGFASVVYALLLLHSDLAQRVEIVALVAAAVLVSVVVHASSDVPVAAVFAQVEDVEEEPL